MVRDWDSIFNSLENIPSDKTEFFSRNFQKLLKSYSLTVPHNLEDLIKRGLPCTCSRPPEINNSNDGTEVKKGIGDLLSDGHVDLNRPICIYDSSRQLKTLKSIYFFCYTHKRNINNICFAVDCNQSLILALNY